MTQNPTKTKYTITAAHRITGKSKTTIRKHLQQGKLSYELGDSGAKLITAVELARAYGDACDFSREEGGHTASQREEGASPAASAELVVLRQRVETMEEERRREREQLRSQIDHLQDALRLAQEGHNRATLLLEQRAGQGAARNVEQELRDEIQQVAESAKAEAKRELLNQPFWRLLWA